MSSYPDGVSVFQPVDGVSVYPIRAATSPPFLHTNLVIVQKPNGTVIVDPGGYDEEALAKALSSIPKNVDSVFVLITHKHHDHWQSLGKSSFFAQLALIKEDINRVGVLGLPVRHISREQGMLGSCQL